MSATSLLVAGSASTYVIRWRESVKTIVRLTVSARNVILGAGVVPICALSHNPQQAVESGRKRHLPVEPVSGRILEGAVSSSPNGRLDSWKEIAEYLGRDLRTVQRWEDEKGLPVHRVPGGKRQAVFAYRTEIEAWLRISGERDVSDTAANEPRVARKRRLWRILVPVLLATGLIAGGLYYSSHRPQPLTARDTIVLADFDNKTGDAVFDDAPKTALSVSLRQSPFLNVFSDDQVAATLQLMSRPANTPLTPELARELCLRAGNKAYIAGSIAGLGNAYVLELKAISCQSGSLLAQEQATAAGKEKVLDALGQVASKLREELGESLATVQKFDVPLAEATTSSLEALKAYSLARKVYREKGAAAALPYGRRAIELDPNFASGYKRVAWSYARLGQIGRARDYFTKAFQLREHATELERLAITADYYRDVTGELDKAAQTYEEEIEIYPRDFGGRLDWDGVCALQGRYEKALELAHQNLHFEPNYVGYYASLADYLIALQRFDDARQIVHEAQARKLDDYSLHLKLYALAFIGADSSAMAEQLRWFAGKPEENNGLSLASDTEAYAGHLRKARELTRRSIDSAVRADNKESAAIWQENAALREAAFGNATEARQAATVGLKLAPASSDVQVEAALAFAMVGDTRRAKVLAGDLSKRYPLNTQLQSLWLPAIQAQSALERKNPTQALNDLQTASAIEFGNIAFVNNGSCLYHVYIRGVAYLSAGQGRPAAAEFQKVLDHSGIVWNCWTGALAHLGLARANALELRNSQGADADARVRALGAYKDFLTLWKDADPDIPILKDAKAEYAKLQ